MWVRVAYSAQSWRAATLLLNAPLARTALCKRRAPKLAPISTTTYQKRPPVGADLDGAIVAYALTDRPEAPRREKDNLCNYTVCLIIFLSGRSFLLQ